MPFLVRVPSLYKSDSFSSVGLISYDEASGCSLGIALGGVDGSGSLSKRVLNK